MKLLFNVLILVAIISCSSSRKTVGDYVDPFIGTDFHGHTYPGATVPNGAVQLSPETRRLNWDACSGYHYSDSTIIGFSHTHLSGTGCCDLGDILFHPTTEEINPNNEGYCFTPLSFLKKNESASPGYYRVLTDNGILSEFTATKHTGIHRYTFPKDKPAKIIIDIAHTISGERIDSSFCHIVDNTSIMGGRKTYGWIANHYVNFYSLFSQPFKSRIIHNGNPVDGDGVENGNIQIELTFEPGSQVVAIVGLSSVSGENAKLNVEEYTKDYGLDFEKYHNAAKKEWNESLSKIKVEGDETLKKIFYTALYHSYVVPNLVSDVDGSYRRTESEIAKSGVPRYSTLSLWDTFRAWHPLFTLLDTTLVSNIISSMLDMSEINAELPIWALAYAETGCMIGYHSVSVIADAYKKGIRGYNSEMIIDAMRRSSTNVTRKGTDIYAEKGYIPVDKQNESISCTLENCYDDWCIAEYARMIGDSATYREYAKRALNYRNVFDDETCFFRPKYSNGSWYDEFIPTAISHAYTEATPWQYRFFVPHDIQGLVGLFGGQDRFENALDSIFIAQTIHNAEIPDVTGLIGQYAHGNEPSHHIAYLYNYIGKPWKTQSWIRRIQHEMYTDKPDGISGNEDCGQMSAWYVMSAMGLYAVCPGTGEYVFNTPIFNKIELTLPNGKILKITANNPTKNQYISKVLFNGNEITKNYITHEMLMQGGELRFILDDKPNLNRGTKPDDKPYSLSKEVVISHVDLNKNVSLFAGSAVRGLNELTPNVRIPNHKNMKNFLS